MTVADRPRIGSVLAAVGLGVLVAGLTVAGASAATGTSGVADTPAQDALLAQQQQIVVSMAPSDIDEGGDATLEVTVANARPSALRGVSVRVDADGLDVRNDQRVVGALEPGGERTFTFTAEGVDPGEKRVDVYVTFSDVNGSRHGAHRRRFVSFERASVSHPDLAIGAGRVGPSGETTLNLTVANGLNRSIRSLALEVDPTGFDVAEPRRVRSAIASGTDVGLSFDVSNASAGRAVVPVAITYTPADGERRTFERTLELTFQAVRNPARITLTELAVTRDSGDAVVRGSASNVGGSDAESVLVTVLDGEGVGPAEAESTFFVGEVPASDFTSFEVAAAVDANETVSIPLRVSYVTDGTRINRTQSVRYSPPSPGENAPERNEQGGLPLVPIAVVAVLGVAVLAWRRLR